MSDLQCLWSLPARKGDAETCCPDDVTGGTGMGQLFCQGHQELFWYLQRDLAYRNGNRLGTLSGRRRRVA